MPDTTDPKDQNTDLPFGTTKLFRAKVNDFLLNTVMTLVRNYFRLKLDGAHHIPRKGRALIVPNHSGFAGLDALLLADSIKREKQRIPRVVTHKFWFQTKWSSMIANQFGFIKANFANGVAALNKNNLVVLFPEGEHGNFKPSRRMYQLEEFHRGFIRMALETGSPIVPCLIVGAEESQLNWAQIQLPKKLKNLLLPIPVNLVPLPAKWTITFFPPVELHYPPEAAENEKLVRELADEMQDQMQEHLNHLVKKRTKIF